MQNEAGARLTEFGQENMLVMENTLYQQHKTWLYPWTSPRGSYENQIDYILSAEDGQLYIVSKNKTGSWLSLIWWVPIAKFRIQLKKVEKTSRPFRYDLQSNPLQLYSGSDKQS